MTVPVTGVASARTASSAPMMPSAARPFGARARPPPIPSAAVGVGLVDGRLDAGLVQGGGGDGSGDAAADDQRGADLDVVL